MKLPAWERAIEPMIVEIAKLEVEPGDSVVFMLKDRISDEQATKLREWIEARILPVGVKAVILGDGVTISVIKKEYLSPEKA